MWGILISFQKGTTLFILCAAIVVVAGCGSTAPKRGKIDLGTEKRFGELPASMEISEIDKKTWAATLPSHENNFHVQKDPDHCWAACVQTAMDLHKATPVPTQVALHERFVDNPMYKEDRQAASYDEIRFALAPQYRNQMIGYIAYDILPTNTSDLIRELSQGHAVIVGLREPGLDVGHAYVVYGMSYRETKNKWWSPSDLIDKARGIGGVIEKKEVDKNDLEVPDYKYEAIEFYLFDPYEPVPEAPKYGGGQKTFTLEKIEGLLDFAISSASAREYFERRNAWLREYDDGPGLYIRNPVDPQGKPLRRETLGDVTD